MNDAAFNVGGNGCSGDGVVPERIHLLSSLPSWLNYSARNVSLIKRVILVNTLRTVRMRSTIFVDDLLHHPDSATESGIVKCCGSAEYHVLL
jgi:hypothetical protein